MPEEVRSAVSRQLAEAGIVGADPLAVAGLFTPVELTPQSAPDWLVDFSKLADGRLCGSGGCLLQVWVKIGQAPYGLAFHRQLLSHEVAHHENGRRWLSIELHGVHCNGTGSDECHYNIEWQGKVDDPAGHFAAVSIRGQPARYEGPLLQALPVAPPVEGPVMAVLTQYRSACESSGGTARATDALARLPDLTGDGREELLFDPLQAECLRADATSALAVAGETHLFVNDGAGWHSAWRGAISGYAIDYASPQPRLLLRPSACTPECAEQALRWHEAERRFLQIKGDEIRQQAIGRTSP